MASEVIVRNIELADAPIMAAAFAAVGWRNKSEVKFRRYFRAQQTGSRDVLVALYAGEFGGYGTIAWEPNYPPFRESGIPEIQDLNVLPRFRRRGVATAIMDEAESRIASRSPVAGIGVGLYADYGPAQRMYVLRGYVPDGKGITFHDEYVSGGDEVVADDDLILFLTKRLH
ncbi:MAG TPA: GNAT family N-acetyltransferase [Terriglobales bacterium]|nr:GNAT family N-acetyltransferase [Terriglobales bacterium]